ncbi:MAG: hypothetical protein L6Q92_00200 [Phycisphaerae bacterium]|nr:hypothetical protein [Phycisphaerae bacterium]
MSEPREITTKRKLDQRRLTVAERKRAAAVLRNLAEGVPSIDDRAAAGFLSSDDGRFLVNVATRLRRTDPPSARHIALALAWLGAVVNQKMVQYARPAHPDQLKPENIVRVCHAAADALAGPQAASAGDESDDSSPTKAKRSTERGEGRAKLIAALTKHHRYADGSCLNLDPIGNNELARLADVDQATASAFFKQQFNGHGKYKAACADAAQLAAALKLLNGEFAPHILFGAKPPGEGERDEE